MTDRRTGGVGVTVDLDRTPGITLNRQVGAVGVNVDLRSILSGTVSTTQAQAVSVQIVVLPGGTSYPITVSAGQATVAALRFQPSYLRLAISQATATTLEVYRLPSSIPRTVVATQPTQVNVSPRLTLRRTLTTLTQAQSATSLIGRGYIRTVTATQSVAVNLRKMIGLTRATTGNRRVSMSVSLGRVIGRVLRITRPTSVRLVRQVRLTRAITQTQSVALAGVPVTLQAVTTVQTRSLALGRAIALVRGIVQATAVYLPSGSSVERTLQVPTVLSRQQTVSLTRAVEQSQAVSLQVRDLTPLLELVVSTTVGQSLSISSAGAGRTAREFVVGTRSADFVVAGRSGQFSAARRGVRFTVESR